MIIRDGKRILHQFHFEIVGGCQLRCVGCPTPNIHSHVKSIGVDLFARCLRNVDVDVVRHFRLFNYGEPLLHPDLPGIGRVLETEAPFEFENLELSTNAQSVNWESFEIFLKQGRLSTLAVSCDGDGSPDSYERLRPPAKWARLLEFLHKAAAVRDAFRPDLKIITRTIISDPCHKERWLKLLEPLKITPSFRKWKYLPQSSTNMTGRAVQPGSDVCFHVGQGGSLFVDHEGHMVPCCIHPGAGDLGDLALHSYSRLLHGDVRKDFLRELAEKRSTMTVCGCCEFGPIDNPGPSAGD